jgi:hypothetical protein
VTAYFARKSGLRLWAPVLALFLAGLATGCHKNEVQFYRVAKGEAEAGPSADSPDPRIHWTSPAGWKPGSTGQFELFSFAAAGPDGRSAKITVVPLDGPAGGELDNVNRWRRQLQLAPIGESEIKSQAVTIGGAPGKIYDLVAENPASPGGRKARTVAASVFVGGATWFFKLNGDEDVVAGQQGAFNEFLISLTFDTSAASAAGNPVDAAATAASAPPSTAPAAPAAPAIPFAAPAADSGAPSEPQWGEIPKEWVKQAARSMRVGTFTCADASGSAEIAVSVFPGDVGGPLANVNRWRGQISLGPVDDAGLLGLMTSLDVAGVKAMLVDMAGTSAATGSKARLVAASVPKDGRTWFFKMVGDDATVAAQKAAFLRFVQATRLPNG